MSSTIKRGLCWALTALQVTPENVQHELVSASVTSRKPFLDVVPTATTTILTPDDPRVVEDSENVRPTYSRQEIADHCNSESCWMVINNKVYDVTRFLRMHPGGDDIMLEYGGHDATSAFIDKGHSLDAFDMLAEYCIGEVTKEDWLPEINTT